MKQQQRQTRPLRIAITGATGGIGSTVSHRLFIDGHSIVMIDRKRSERPLPDAPFVECDTRDHDRIAEALEGVDVVCHLGEIPNVGIAGVSDREVFDTNTAGCRTMLNVAVEKRVRRFVYTSSCQIYGFWGDRSYPVEQTPVRWPLDELQPPAPRNAYAYSKAINEVACRETSARAGLPIFIFRFPWVMEPKPADERIRARWAKVDETIGEGFWTYLDLRDAVEAYALAVRDDRPLEPMPSSCEAFHFVADDVIAPLSTREKFAKHLPHFAPLPEDWPERRSPVSCAKAERYLGWRAEHRMAELWAATGATGASAGR